MTNMLCKSISLLLVAAMLFSLNFEAFAINSGDGEGEIDSGNVLTLPALLEGVEEEAFYGAESIDTVVIPYGMVYIGLRAFAYSGVKRIHIPETVTEIAEDAFEGTDGLMIVSAGDCYACDYAQAHKITWMDEDIFFSLSGLVTDYNTGTALAGVKVTLTTPLDGSITAYTDASGAYSFKDVFKDVPYDTHRLVFEKAYYETLTARVTMAVIGNTQYNASLVPDEEDEPILEMPVDWGD